VKGVLALETEIRRSRTRLLKLSNAGRLGVSPEATRCIERLAEHLKQASLLAGALRQYEVGRRSSSDIL